MRTLLFLGMGHLMACGEEEEEKVNSIPIITNISISPSGPIFTSSEIQCIATASDDDNDSLTMSYQWLDQEDNLLGETADLVLNSSMAKPGESVFCVVTVSDGEAIESGQTNVVIENTPPEVTEVQITPNDIVVDSLLDCSFRADDADGENYTASYSWTRNGVEVGDTNTLQLHPDDFSNGDTMTCTVTIEDESGGVGTGSADTVIGNTAPVIGTTMITPESPYSFDVLTCTTDDITDLDENEVTLSYEWIINSQVHTETSNVLAGPFAVDDIVVCRVTPNDGYANGIMSQDVVTILNSAPTIDSIEITPTSDVQANTLLTCSVVGSDQDNEELTISYSWTDSSGTVLATTDVLQLNTSTASPDDEMTCTATVTDPHGESAMQTAMVLVNNTEPIVDSAAVITGDATTTSTVTCFATFSDENDGALISTYRWNNGQGSLVGTGSTYTITATDTNVGEALICTASASDSNGAVVLSSASTTIVNTAPVLSGVSLSPDPAGTTDSLTCSVASTSDIDEDVVSVVYQWTINGAPSSETSDILSSPFVVGSEITCTATANDDRIDGNSETASITIRNALPVVDAVVLDSGPVYTNDTLTAATSLSDSDSGQTISATYDWHVVDASDGGASSLVQSGAEATLDGSLFDKDDAVYVTVTPNDGVEDGVSVMSETVTVSNSEPTDLTASVTSSDMFYNDSTLTCSASASDIDPEDTALTYDYEWSTGDTGADVVLSGSMMPGSDITCTASVTDGSGASISIDATEVLVNRAPTVDSVTLPQDVTAETASILCDATGSDLDGETPTFTYEWTMNGSAHVETSDTFTDTYSYNDIIGCTVTAVDSTEDGSSMTASTTIANSTPAVDSVSLDSDPVYTTGTVTATVVLVDADANQTVTAMYSWFVKDASNGGALSNVQNSVDHTLDGTFFDKDDEVYVTVKPNDGVEDGDSVTSASIIIDNSEPELSSIVITPASATVEDDLTCSVTGADADGDTIEYTFVWTDPTGAETTIPSTSSTTNTLLAADSSEGVWTCSATPNDGTTDGASDSTTITVESTAGEEVTGFIKPFGADNWLFEVTDTSVAHTITMQKKSVDPLNPTQLGERMINLYAPNGTLLTGQWGEYMGSRTSLLPYSFTPTMTGTYRVVAYGYLNDQGGYGLDVSNGSQLLLLTGEEQIPTPSTAPMTLFSPTQPTSEWTETVTGDFDLSKKTETWVFDGLAEQNLRIDMSMVAPYPDDRDDHVDARLYLFDSNGTLIASDDDTGSGTSARIYYTLEADGAYHLVATTYGDHRAQNWGNVSGTDWTLGADGIGHYELTVNAKDTFDFELEPVTMTNEDAVPINVVLLYQDEDKLNIPRPKSEIEDLVADLNDDFDSLYSNTHWEGFEIASYTHYYEPDYSFTGNPHGALADVGASPAALTEHINLIITEIDDSATGIVGTTNLKGDFLAQRGVALVLDNEAGSSVLIHEMGHVLGVQHTAGTWPPKQHFIDLADGAEMGYSTFDHPCPESTHMSQWDNYGFSGDWSGSWYLTSGESTLNTATHGRLFSEALRTWLIDNAIISSSAPTTGYQGFDEGDGNADAYWTWAALEDVDESTEHGVLPLSVSASDASNLASVLVWEKTGTNEALIRYRDSAGVWEDAESMPLSTGGIIRGKRAAIGSQGHAAALIEGDPEQLELRFHDGQSTSWGATEIVSAESSIGSIVYQGSLAVNGLGETVVTWVYREEFGADYEVRLRTRSELGVWSTPEVLYTGADEVAYPEIAMNDAGDIYAVWQRMDAGVFVTEGQWRDGDTDVWGSVMTLSSGIYHAGLAQVAIDAAGDAVIVWREADTVPTSVFDLALEGHLVSRSFTAPSTLGSPDDVSAIGADAFHTSTIARRNNVVLNDIGEAAVAWSGFDGEDYRIYVAERSSSLVWGSPVALSSTGQHAKLPNLVQDDEGTLAVSWQRTDGHHSRIQASVLDTSSGMWSAPVTLSDEGEPAFWSTLGADGGGQFSVFWSRTDGSRYQVQSRIGTMTP